MLANKPLRLLALAAVASLAGCAPVTFAPGGGLGLYTGPGLGFNLTSCSSLGLSSQAARLGLSSASIQVGALRNQVAEIQSRAMAGSSSVRRDMSSWRRAATGEC